MLEILVLERVADMDVLCVVVRKEGREIIEIAMLCEESISSSQEGEQPEIDVNGGRKERSESLSW
jgi:hypothetical protein